MKTIKWGIIGAGNIAGTFAGDINLVEGSEIHAVASRSMDKANDFAKKYDIKKTYDSYEALASDPEIDVIYIATPHCFHKDQAIMCMQHKKAVLCEKPMAVSLDEMTEMIAVADKEEVFLMEAMWTRFKPVAEKLRSLISEEFVGEIRYMSSDFGFCLGDDHDPKSRLLSKDLAGGALLDVGVYPVAMTHMVMGASSRVSAQQLIGPTGVDLQSSASYAYANSLAMIHCAINAKTNWETLITGTKGSIKIPESWFGTTIEWTNDKGETESETFEKFGSDYTHEVMAVASALREGLLEHPLMTHQDSIDIMTMMEQIMKA